MTERSPSQQLIVAALDDNAEFLAKGLLELEQEGYDLRTFTSPQAFIDAVVVLLRPPVLLVDHDLGCDVYGYDVVRQIRQQRMDGLLLPVVYLTGRESEQGYLSNEVADPYGAPSLFVSKRDLYRLDLPSLVDQLAGQFAVALVSADREAVQRAAAVISTLEDDVFRSI